MEKFGLLQLLSSFAKNSMQGESDAAQQPNILDIFMGGNQQQNTTTPPPQSNANNTSNQNSTTIFTTEIRQRQFNNILLRHEEISRRIDRRNKH